MELPGRYIGGIFQIYYPLICYIGGREGRKEGELHYFFVVPSYVKFVGSFIHTGSSGLYIHLHTTSLPLFLFRHSLRRRGRCEIFPKFFVGAASLILVGHGVLTSLVSLPSKSNLPNPALKARNASSFPSRPSRQSSSRAFKVPSPQPRFINRSCRPHCIISDAGRQATFHFT